MLESENGKQNEGESEGGLLDWWNVVKKETVH